MQQSDNLTARIGRWSTQHRKTAIFGWLAFVLASVVIGMNLMPQKEIDPQTAGGPGESGQAAEALDGAFDEASTEQVLIQSTDLNADSTEVQVSGHRCHRSSSRDRGRRQHRQSVQQRRKRDLERRSLGTHHVRAPRRVGWDRGGEREGIARRCRRSTRGAPSELTIASRQSATRASTRRSSRSRTKSMGKSTMISLPLTLIILTFAFGALVAAGIPLLLALTSVAATLGLLGPISHIAPVDGSVMHVVLLVGMAVGIDYSLFYVKRAREERAAGRGNDAAIEAAAATSGRAVVISGITVMVAMAGMYLGGISNFASFATGTILVVAVAVIGSLTVLPALLSKLGDWVKGPRAPVDASTAGSARAGSGPASSTRPPPPAAVCLSRRHRAVALGSRRRHEDIVGGIEETPRNIEGHADLRPGPGRHPRRGQTRRWT